MLLTIVILVVAVALFLFAGALFGADKKKSAAMVYAKKAVKLVALVLLVVGVNRTGVGTSYYLTEKNPAILQVMIENMREAQTREATKAVKEYVVENAAKLEENAPVLGNVEGKKVVYLFSDYTCPYCHRVHGELEKVMAEDKDVKVVLKNFSVHGPLSDAPAKAVIAAKLQDNAKAAALDGKLMSTTEWFGKARSEGDPKKIEAAVTKEVMKFAKEVGLDTKQLEKDMAESPKVAQELYQVRELTNRFQISGTPYLIVNNQSFPGAIPADQIKAALAK
jgi:protein-disulfide isomerase